MSHTKTEQALRAILLGGTIVAGLCAAQGASAQPFSSVVAFGDSYADNGNVFRLAGVPFPPQYPTGRFSGGTNFVDTTATLLGVPQFNFAIGGAQAGATNVSSPLLPGFQQEYTGFIRAGGFFLPTDVLAISIGGNDARAYELAGRPLSGVNAAASVTAAQATAGINALVGVGARNIVFTAGDVGSLAEVVGRPIAQIGTAYSQAYNAQMQQNLAVLAASGVRVEYIDNSLVLAAVRANPASGITNFTQACLPACLNNPALQAQYAFYDTVHLTSAAFSYVGQYIVNRLNAPLTLSAQGDLGLRATTDLVSTMFGRLDLFGADRGPTIVPAAPVTFAPPRVTKGYDQPAPVLAAPQPVVNPFSVYILANGSTGRRNFGASTIGYDWDSIGGTIGAEYRFGREAIVGGLFQFSNPNARLNGGFGTTDAQSYQFGLYGAITRNNFFAQGLIGGGFQNYNNVRPGVLLGNISSSPTGSSFAAAGKIGYLFETPFSIIPGSRSRIGPIVGATYATSHTGNYTEAGDPALTLNVGRQRAELLVGSAGAQLRNEFALQGTSFETFTNITAEKDFRGSGRLIQYGATSAPIIVNTFGVPNPSDRVYARISSGFSVGVIPGVALQLTTSSSFFRKGGNDFGGQGGVKISF